MFDLREYYAQENEAAQKDYEKTIALIPDICTETQEHEQRNNEEYYHFFNKTGNLILKLAAYEAMLDTTYFSKKTFEELLHENNTLFSEIEPGNYATSYANPTYAVQVFGDRFGQLMSSFYCQYRKYIVYAFYHKRFKMAEHNQVFVDVFTYIKSNKPSYERLKDIVTQHERVEQTKDLVRRIRERFDTNYKYVQSIIDDVDSHDLRYLLRYGAYITDNEIKTAEFLATYSHDKIEKLCRQIVSAYVAGFQRDNKDLSKKSTVSITFRVGQERMVRQLIQELEKRDLHVLFNNVSSTSLNRQYIYDHAFDTALYLDNQYVARSQDNYQKACEECKDMLAASSGVIALTAFGEQPFAPENKKERPTFTEEQQVLYQRYQHSLTQIQDRYLPQKETSFTLISFPSPEIGKDFEHIFEDIFEVNMLDNKKFEHIQQTLIDVLDSADYVHVKGKNNKTNIKVKMNNIKNRERETNFYNCGADVNIPIGEVFTSPQLKGTNGILHVTDSYLKGLKFIDLELVFTDGYITSYTCKNFTHEEENKKYIEDNLLFPYKTLPLGEFAIGTNTLAYVVAKKYGIMHILPVLIIEKMGPHFAIGDTCFALSEDHPVYNRLNKREMIARENEKTALRKTSMHEAYTNRHTDITLPYESIESITVVTKEGELIDIIRDGRFVLEGTTELNKPFST